MTVLRDSGRATVPVRRIKGTSKNVCDDLTDTDDRQPGSVGRGCGKLGYWSGSRWAIIYINEKDPLGGDDKDQIMPYGCKKIAKDSDKDGIPDSKDKCPNTALGAPVSNDGCSLDTDQDGVPNYLDECPTTPLGYDVAQNGCAISITLNINFATSSAVIPKSSYDEIERFIDFMKLKKNYNAHIIGHTDNVGSEQSNQQLSLRRAKSLNNYLIKHNIDSKRLTYEGRGESDPKVNNDTPENRYTNRRVEIELTKGEL